MLSSASSSSPATTCCAACDTYGSAAELRIKTRSSIASCTVSSSKEEWSINMALYIDSAFLHDIMNVAKTVPLAGVTTNPSILLAARERGQRRDAQSLLNELLQKTEGLIFMQPGVTQEGEMLVQARSYINADVERVIPKLPMTNSGLRVGQVLKRQGHRIAFTAVTSVSQAYTAALAGADYIIPYCNRLERSGVDASDRVAQMATLLH